MVLTDLKVPDLWQQKAVQELLNGRDVVVNAPTGAGKTYIFEMLVKQGLRHQAIYTVPTRALANDKLLEWEQMGWHVGITTGDATERPNAPIVVATLETQKGNFLRGRGPGLLVIDEYQMIIDPGRGMNYELAIALAPPSTQLLLLSGSVANPKKIVQWLRQIGRDAALIDHRERPVPLDEIDITALPSKIPNSVKGFWPRIVARALAAELGPILVFAPQRRDAELLAARLSKMIPCEAPLILSPEQRKLAEEPLAKMLRNRIAYHHSGLSYPQRAGLIEPLAKLGHLRVVVATTGLAAGINFSMRSALVTEREYQHGGKSHLVRPDELLQMFGRAGRRGLDQKGYILVAPGKPRLSEGRPIHLKRHDTSDWPSFIAVMDQAARQTESPIVAAETLAKRLFSSHPIRLGLKSLNTRNTPITQHQQQLAPPKTGDGSERKLREIMNSKGEWERQRPKMKTCLGEALIYIDNEWVDSLSVPDSLKLIPYGNLCRLKGKSKRCYGRIIPLAIFPKKSNQHKLMLVKSIYRNLRHYMQQSNPGAEAPPRLWERNELENELLTKIPKLAQGGQVVELIEKNNMLSARLDYSNATVLAYQDRYGVCLLNPPVRKVKAPDHPSFAEMTTPFHEKLQPADIWYQLGLIKRNRHPTRRGIIFSFFNHGEGLAIAAALEDSSYAIEDLIYDLANLRAGHRFEFFDNASSRLDNVCRLTYHTLSYPGYLHNGVPPNYGNGAAEVIAEVLLNPAHKVKFVGEHLRTGDIERALLEWRSLLNHICFSPDYTWERWMKLKEQVSVFVASNFHTPKSPALPELTSTQLSRYMGV